eukprot:3658345-Pyramimonas_sp.AAC.2
MVHTLRRWCPEPGNPDSPKTLKPDHEPIVLNSSTRAHCSRYDAQTRHDVGKGTTIAKTVTLTFRDGWEKQLYVLNHALGGR